MRPPKMQRHDPSMREVKGVRESFIDSMASLENWHAQVVNSYNFFEDLERNLLAAGYINYPFHDEWDFDMVPSPCDDCSHWLEYLS